MASPLPAQAQASKSSRTSNDANSILQNEGGALESGIANEKMPVDKSTTYDFGLFPIPHQLRYDPEKPFKFTLLLNIMFGLGSTFTVANLYWCQPLLIQFSESFGVSYSRVSRIPTLLQAGYATGLILLSPLGDIVRRRQMLLMLVIASASLTVGLAVTESIVVFEAISFLVGVVTITPQVLLPLSADLAPPERRASAISMVLSGLLFGVLIARVLAGVIAEFSSWRVVYYVSIGVQFAVLAGLYLMIPDYPAKETLPYWKVLATMAKYAVTEPILIQACLILMAASAVFANFWVTLTFLLGGPPYFYSTLVIGLFGLVGMAGVSTAPFTGRLVDRLIPWYATLFSSCMFLLFQSVQLAAGGINVAAVVIACFGLDVFRQAQQVSVTTAVFGIASSARSRLNAILIFSIFIGQVMGTAVGTKLFVEHGWRAAAGVSEAWVIWDILVLLSRGPHVKRYTWLGYDGGIEPRKSVVEARKRRGEAERVQAVTDPDEKAVQPEVSQPDGVASNRQEGSEETETKMGTKEVV